MRQTFTVVVGQALRGVTLPDGSPAFALAVDNPSSYWYQVYPGGSTIAPNTQRAIVEFPGGAPTVDLVPLATGPAGQPSIVQGGNLTVSLYDAADAPSGDAGALVVAPTAGTLRYVGALAFGSAPGSYNLPVNLVGPERSILVFVKVTGEAIPLGLTAVIGTADDAVRTFEEVLPLSGNDIIGSNSPAPFIGYCNPALSLAWRVHLVVSASPTAGTAYVFTDTAIPERALVNADSPLPVRLMSNSGATGPLTFVSQGTRRPYDSALVAVPALNVVALVTFPATPGSRWVVDMFTGTMHSIAGAAAAQNLQVIDVGGVGLIYNESLVIPATANSLERANVGPGLGLAGSSGSAVTVGFSAAGGANVAQRISAAAYQMEG